MSDMSIAEAVLWQIKAAAMEDGFWQTEETVSLSRLRLMNLCDEALGTGGVANRSGTASGESNVSLRSPAALPRSLSVGAT